jgi:hypothetical protein
MAITRTAPDGQLDGEGISCDGPGPVRARIHMAIFMTRLRARRKINDLLPARRRQLERITAMVVDGRRQRAWRTGQSPLAARECARWLMAVLPAAEVIAALETDLAAARASA